MGEALVRPAADTGHRTLSREARGYLFWGPIALVVTVTELLGVGAVQDWLGVEVPWPTISTTVGHLQEQWAGVAALVVFVIAVTAFTALAYHETERPRTAQGRTRAMNKPEPPILRYYSWQFSLLAILVGWIASTLIEDKYKLGYVIYGGYLLYGVLVPWFLVRVVGRDVNFPTLFFTFAKLRGRFAFVAAVFAALISVLLFHLALYPWPSITSQPSEYAGLTAGKARGAAVREIQRLGVGGQLTVSTQTRGVDDGADAWLVFFSAKSSAGREFAGCIVTVTEDGTTASPECSG